MKRPDLAEFLRASKSVQDTNSTSLDSQTAAGQAVGFGAVGPSSFESRSMNPQDQNNEDGAGGSDAFSNLLLLMELQRQQAQAQSNPQQLQPQQSSGSIPDVQALLLQQRQAQAQQQPLNPTVNPAIVAAAAALGHQQQPTENELEALLRQRESVFASQLINRRLQQQQQLQHVDAILASQVAAQQQTTTPLSALYAPPGDVLQQALLQAAIQQNPTDAALLTQTRESVASEVGQTPSEPAASSQPKEDSDEEEEEEKAATTGEGKVPESESDAEEEEAGNEDDEEEDHPANDTFPFKLHRMLEHAEKNDLEGVISFTSEGKSFAIHKPREFVSNIMPRYFTTSRMSSFQRQLNLYGFRRITEGREKGAYFHKHFLKGKRGLCKKIKRKKTSSKATQAFDAQTRDSMSIRQLLAERQFGAPPSFGLSAGLGTIAAAGAVLGGPGQIDASQALANMQLNQRLELLMRQKQEEARLLQQQQQNQQAQQQELNQQQQAQQQGFPPSNNGGGGEA